MKNNKQTEHVTMRGRRINMDLLQKKNELTPAVGNANMNARGDRIKPNGKIVETREKMLKKYYEDNPRTVSDPVHSRKTQVQDAVQEQAPSEKTSEVKSTVTEPSSQKTAETSKVTSDTKTASTVKPASVPATNAGKAAAAAAKKDPAKIEMEDKNDEWVEDKDGNFVKKEDLKKVK